jgi:hypothetical protein
MASTDEIAAGLRQAGAHADNAQQAVQLGMRLADEAAGSAATAGFSTVAAILHDAVSDMGGIAAMITPMPVILGQAVAAVEAIGTDASADQVGASLTSARESAWEAVQAAHEQVLGAAWEVRHTLEGVLEGADPQMAIGALADMESFLDHMTIAVADTTTLIDAETARARSLAAHPA